jgi:hypothetical protein
VTVYGGLLLSLAKEVERDLATLLRLVYDKANWKRIGRNSDPMDVFSHKIKAASHQESLPRFLDKLCYSLGVQSVEVPVELVRRLDANRGVVLKALRKETIFYMLTALEVN